MAEPRDRRGRRRAGRVRRPRRRRPARASTGRVPHVRSLPAASGRERTRRGSGCGATASASMSPRTAAGAILAERAVDPGPEWTTRPCRSSSSAAGRSSSAPPGTGSERRRSTGCSSSPRTGPTPSGRTRWRRSRTASGEHPDPRLGRVGGLRRSGRESAEPRWSAGPPGSFPAGRYRLSVRLRAAAGGPGPARRGSRSTEPAGRSSRRARYPRGGAVRRLRGGGAGLRAERSDRARVPGRCTSGDVGVFLDRVTVTPRLDAGGGHRAARARARARTRPARGRNRRRAPPPGSPRRGGRAPRRPTRPARP